MDTALVHEHLYLDASRLLMFNEVLDIVSQSLFLAICDNVSILRARSQPHSFVLAAAW